MLTLIKDEDTGFEEVSKSKFYSYSFKVSDEEEVDKIIKRISAEHKDARHVVYAYNLKSGKGGASENKEPTSSMHKLLSLMQSKGIMNVLIVIVRYFGGVLLGAGPLDRLYFHMGSDLIKEENLRETKKVYIYKGTIGVSYYNHVKDLIKGIGKINSTSFSGPEAEVEFCLGLKDEKILSYFSSYELIKEEEN